MTSPTREQAMAHLEIANRIRLERADLKRRLKRRELTLADALEEDAAQAAGIGEILRALPRYGQGRMFKLLERVPIVNRVGLPDPIRRVENLTPRQRLRLSELVD